MRRRAPAALVLTATALSLAATAAPAPAQAAQTTTQRFFAARLLEDDRTSREIREMLRSGRGFVERRVVFRDLTGDDKRDALVRVQSGGAAGTVALYVLSTDTGRRRGELKVVFRSQELLLAETRIRDGVLRYRSARPQPADELCCPSRFAETRLRWRERRHRLTVVERREVDAGSPWGDQLP
jgi:hypothetical protein